MILVLNDIRSTYNVGSIFRTAEGTGIEKIILCGITPYPEIPNDPRPRRIIDSNTKQIHKTALDAENLVPFEHNDNISSLLKKLKKAGFTIIALENKRENTQNIFNYSTNKPIVLVLGSETDGIDKEICNQCDVILEIPMYGEKNSLNVSVAAGIAAYRLMSNSKRM